uniref:Uncharacterized protein n=1 Tax=Romanomermis culicivorax TaxID=13658 RepID=A0A915L033_ROMCU
MFVLGISMKNNPLAEKRQWLKRCGRSTTYDKWTNNEEFFGEIETVAELTNLPNAYPLVDDATRISWQNEQQRREYDRQQELEAERRAAWSDRIAQSQLDESNRQILQQNEDYSKQLAEQNRILYEQRIKYAGYPLPYRNRVP